MSSDSSLADAVGDESEDRSRMSFLEHLDELAPAAAACIYVLGACCAVTFYFWDPLYRYFIQYFNSFGGQLVFTKPMAGFMFSMKISALAGLGLASPFLFTQVWLFVAPGLYARRSAWSSRSCSSRRCCSLPAPTSRTSSRFPSMWRFFASYEVPALPAAGGASGRPSGTCPIST